jgi:superfamily II DNA/RNA helicase
LSNFTDFNLDEKILKTLQEIGYETPTPIQAQAIPKILEGVDVIACAQTGTGKTAAFMLPILHLLCQPLYRSNGGPQALILVPTRELAMQVAEETKKFSRNLSKTKTVCIYGGVPYPIQKKALSQPYEILVATPGRLMDHMQQGRIDLSGIKLLVLDEADRMLDMGFIDAVEQIADAAPKDRQTLLFSATIDRKILPFSKKLQNNPHEVKVAHAQTTQDNIEQRLYYVDGIHHKIRVLEHLLANTEMNQTIVFTSTINQANELADHLYEKGYTSEALHGDMNQNQRSRTINKLRCGRIQVLVATDVAARGIDIASLSHVINFDLPFQADDFIHRVGRTGRAGAKGTAITFSTYKEELKLSKINKLMGTPLALHTIEGLEPKAKEMGKSNLHRPKPRFRSSGGSRGEGSFGNRDRSEGSFSRPRGESSFGNRERSEGSFGNNRPRIDGAFGNKEKGESSFSRPRGEGSFSKPRSESSFGNRERSEGSFGKPRGESRFANKPKSEGSFDQKKSKRPSTPFSKPGKARNQRLYS